MKTVFVCCKNDRRETMHKAGLLAARKAVMCESQSSGIPKKTRVFIKKDALGKPTGHIAGIASGIAVSISHSFPFACSVADASNRLIGVDVERVREFKKNIWEAFLTPTEKSIISSLPRKQRPFLRTLAWALKESALKAYGTGIRTHPNRVDVSRFLRQDKTSGVLNICGRKYASYVSWEKVGEKHVLAVVALRV